MAGYPYDPEVRRLVAQVLWSRLPAWLRHLDGPPTGEGDLRSLLQILAGPLAAVRQNIEELHADLFIDSASPESLALHAEMIGTSLIFSDPDANRRDVRGTVGWRRRKGTPAALEELSEDITGQLVVTQEGFLRAQVTQDVRRPFLLRMERVVPDLRNPLLPDTSHGPLDATHHAVDVRPISRTTGLSHPKHVVHWLHPMTPFVLRRAEPVGIDSNGGSDRRFALSPHAAELAVAADPEVQTWLPLRAARQGSADGLATDRIPGRVFTGAPEDWFGKPGRFAVFIAGVWAGVPLTDVGRVADPNPASGALVDNSGVAVAMEILEVDTYRQRGDVRVRLWGAPAPAPGDVVDLTGADEVADVVVTVASQPGQASTSAIVNTTSGAGQLPIVELTEPTGTYPVRLGATTIELRGNTVAATRTSEFDGPRREGFHRGVLRVRLPELVLTGPLVLMVAADGSLYQTQSAGSGEPLDVPVDALGGGIGFPRDQLLSVGVGAAWPPLPATAVPTALRSVPPGPGQSPAILHHTGVTDGAALVGGTVDCALEFAVRTFAGGSSTLRPVLRIEWVGPDPVAASWVALDDTGTATGVTARWRDLAEIRDDPSLRLLVRFTSSQADAVLHQSEIVWPSGVLVYLPELQTVAGGATGDWPLAGAATSASEAVWVGVDGATFLDDTLSVARRSLGPVAPLTDTPALRRRRVRGRVLCPWKNETGAAPFLDATPPGELHVDVEHGLFALSDTDVVQGWLPHPDGAAPPVVEVDMVEGFTDHVGARPSPRQAELGRLLPNPTRLVSRTGRLEAGAPPDWHDLPMYASLQEALQAIAAQPNSEEVVRFQDSATYAAESPSWPDGVRILRLHAAEGERPIVRLVAFGNDAATFERVEVIGLDVHLAGQGIAFPDATLVDLAYATLRSLGSPPAVVGFAEGSRVEAQGCVLGGITGPENGRLNLVDSIIDGAGNPALDASGAEVDLQRVTARGAIACGVIEASDCLLELVTVEDRFRGCIRFSRADAASVLPRRHQVLPPVDATDPYDPRFVTLDRRDPAWLRLDDASEASAALASNGSVRLLRGAEDGSEVGAFARRRLPERLEGLRRRLAENLPAGLVTAPVRLD